MSEPKEFKGQLRVAIIGDPHFFTPSDAGNASISHVRLTSSGEFIDRQPQHNPWEGLKLMVSEQSIVADVLLCVGDITYCADNIGLKKAWDELQQLAALLGARHLVTATGNHDILSRSIAKRIATNPTRELSSALGLFEPLKTLSPPYPVVEFTNGIAVDHRLTRTKYFGDSLVLVEADHYRILVLNSCCEHGSDAYQYERGTFPKSAQRALAEELNSATSEKINILVCHHPPEPHSEHDLGSHDFIENGEALIQCLERHGSWLIVHGHKHHGRITYAKGTGSAPVIFAAASLGIHLDLTLSGMRNQFYCTDVYQKSTGRLLGKVAAWDWFMGTGWRKATPKPGGIFDGCGFGARQPIEDIAEEISKLIPCSWQDVASQIPNVAFLTPDEMNLLELRLRSQYSVVIEPDDNGYWTELARGMA